jgi:hypothetical protein
MTDSDTHAVQFRGGDGAWLDGAADVLSSALQRGDTIATVLLESNRDALALLMKERRWNLADLGEQGRYLMFDAEAAATQVMRGGCPDVDTLTGLIDGLERARSASGDRARSHLTIVGEIAPVLWRNGNPDAALEVERLWDELTRSLPILTICAYPMGYLGDEAMAAFSSDVCAHHSVVSRAVKP